MEGNVRREAALENIQQNISLHGHHIYVVSGPPDPRFAYTIGLGRSLGFELILAGASFYMLDDVSVIINDLASKLKTDTAWRGMQFEVSSLGAFSLGSVDMSWAKALMLGALDFYQVEEISALQVIPDRANWTIDTPNLSEPWNPATAPAWQWLKNEWTFHVPTKSMALTNMAALSGVRITEAARWEDDYWELFAGAGPDVQKSGTRIVPLGLLLTADGSLTPVADLPVGAALWRDEGSHWHPWSKSGE